MKNSYLGVLIIDKCRTFRIPSVPSNGMGMGNPFNGGCDRWPSSVNGD